MSAAFHIRPFDFAEIFDAPPLAEGREASVDELRLRIAALEAELALAVSTHASEVEAARSQTFDAALAQAREEQGAAVLCAIDALHAAVETVEERLDEIERTVAGEAGEIACAAAEMLAARALDWAPAAVIDEAIGRVLRQVARGQEVQVAVHPDLLARIEEAIAVRQSKDRRRLGLSAVADPAIAIGDAHIRWDQGGVILDAASRAASVREALAPLLPAPTPSPAPQPAP